MLHKFLKVVGICLLSLIMIFVASGIRDEWSRKRVVEILEADTSTIQDTSSIAQASESPVMYTPLGVPNINSSFKTYMGWQVWEKWCPNSAQYKFYKKWGWTDSEGFVRCSAEKDLGIKDDYYMVALGSYYGTKLGTKYRITLDTGRVFYAILGEFKANIHTNSTNQYSVRNNDVIEFVVDEKLLNPNVKSAGSANVYMPLNGNVVEIERIDFIN